ncbi:putative efflux protein, MATE family [Peptoclostridium litorale DSM 5388]|uniref:Probable multidrug resistance protein NorM n=1 Tax=Peptoclostridium litorale DSM 5388 TaxID=1121324 RepID=A0A069RNI8_PEPLI|nr:MATE family efflux transporter [Peptoclostridium litorale]KDR95752.1 putative multidrug resistance protein NorM [Peptoclostridium litorale DSM 5388]SIO22031.1 putative efflux protein, MATE family [Peptoclostridium litorale DSM 5388]
MERKKFYKRLLLIAIPIMIQYFISISVNLMDSFMVGKLGESSVAALGIANQYFFIFNLILLGVNSGCGVLISQFWGSKDVRNIKKVLGIALVSGVAASILFVLGGMLLTGNIIEIFTIDQSVKGIGVLYLRTVCLSYVFMAVSMAFGFASRGVEKTVLPMVSSAIALVFNIVFNYAFIFGKFGFPQMGVVGAAYATLIARAVEMTVIVSSIYLKDHIIKSSIKEMTGFDLEFLKRALKTAVPVIVNDLCWGIGMTMYSVVYGRLGTESIAAVQICMSVQNVFMTVLFAVANASSVMVGKEVGRGEYERAKYYASNFVKMSIAMSLVMGAMLYASTPTILSIYNVSSKVMHMTRYMMYVSAFAMPLKFINTLLIVGIMRGGGDAKTALAIELVTMWLIGVPICFITAFVLHMNAEHVYALVLAEELVRVFVCMKRYNSGNWINNVTSEMKRAA